MLKDLSSPTSKLTNHKKEEEELSEPTEESTPTSTTPVMLNFGPKKKPKMLKKNLIKLKLPTSPKEPKVPKNSKLENNDLFTCF
jgi:hypothetical protein